jgi:hypothetical protein
MDGEGVIICVEEGQSRVGDHAADGGAERLGPIGRGPRGQWPVLPKPLDRRAHGSDVVVVDRVHQP